MINTRKSTTLIGTYESVEWASAWLAEEGQAKEEANEIVLLFICTFGPSIE